jgi:predicted aspartyl protease
MVNDHVVLYMIDSGATNNFISEKLCYDLGLNLERCNNCANVRLADGKVLGVIGSVRVIVDFGVF